MAANSGSNGASATRAEAQPSIGVGTIFRRGNRWYFEHKLEGVKQTSLGTSDAVEAETEARGRFGYLLAKSEPERQALVRARIDAEAERRTGTPGIAMETVSIMDAYRAAMGRTGVRVVHADATPRQPLTPRREMSVRSCVSLFVGWCKREHPTISQMAYVTPRIADSYFEELRTGHSTSTYNRYLGILRVVWRRLAIKGNIQENPFDRLSVLSNVQVRAEQRSWEPFTQDEITKVMKESKGWVPCGTAIAYQTGLRLGDVVTLQTAEIDTAGGWITRRTRKGGKTLVLRLTDTSRVSAWLASPERLAEAGEGLADYVFPRLAAAYLGIGRKRDVSRASKEYHRQLGLLEIRTKQGGRTVRGFHSLRVTRATELFNTTGDIQAVKAQLGHSSAATSQGYVQESEDQQKARLLLQGLTPEQRALVKKALTEPPAPSATAPAQQSGLPAPEQPPRP